MYPPAPHVPARPHRRLPGPAGLCTVLLAVLIALAVTAAATPARAQQGRVTAAQERTAEAVRATEAEQADAARAWATARGLPLRVPQPGGGTVELVGVTGRRPRYLTTLNAHAAAVTRTDRLYAEGPLGLALTGRGQRLGIWDSGHVLETHQEFGDRVTFGDASGTEHHATHVAGTLIAAGVNAPARGMAAAARLVSYDWKNDATEMGNEGRLGLLVSNHSYGAVAGWFFGDVEGAGEQWYWLGDATVSTAEDYAFGWYGIEAVQFDRTVHANPFLLPVVAAGNDRGEGSPVTGTYRSMDANGQWQTYTVAQHPHPRDGATDGFDTVAGAAVGKNVLTVGSIRVDLAGEYRSPSGFSSYGPLDDGRIKPDLMGYGENLFSTASSGPAAYGRLSGTSMAAPTVAGTALLLQEHHHTTRGYYLRAATLKGLMLHTARDVGLPGPDYRTGWGLLDAAAAATHLTDALANPVAVLENSLPPGATYRKSVKLDPPGPLRVTLSWTDVPGAVLQRNGPAALDARDPRLVNDLDLRLVYDETGEVYLPYRLDPDHPGEAAAPGDNAVDPVEQVFLADAPAGSYTIEVSHKHTLSGGAAQAFSLLVSGGYDDFVPIAVTHLQADAHPDAVVLNWQTRFERMSGTFVVERAPVSYPAGSGKQVGLFEYVGTLGAGGLSEDVQHYRFEDGRFPAGPYAYRILFDGGGTRYVTAQVEVNIPSPQAYAILSNHPNPFSGGTTLVVDLPSAADLRLEVFDALGRRVALLFEGGLPAGRNHVAVEAGDWAPGVYLVRATTRSAVFHHRLLLQ